MPGVAEPGDPRRVQGRLPGGQDAHGLGLAEGALVVGVERAQAVDFVVEQIDANRICGAHGEDVE